MTFTATDQTTAVAVPWREIESRCKAAARLAFRGDRFGWTDIQDAADELAIGIVAAAPKSAWLTYGRTHVRSSVGGYGPAVQYSKYSAQKSKDRVTLATVSAALSASHVPSFSTLYGKASNLRRSLERSRKRDEDARADQTADDFTSETIAADEGNRANYGTTETAHRTALEMLTALGMSGDYGTYVLAYTAARYGTLYSLDVPSPGHRIAAELLMSPATYRQALSRAIKRIPSATTMDRPKHAEALHVPTGGIALKPSRSRTKTADLNVEPRCKPDQEASVKTTQLPTLETATNHALRQLAQTYGARDTRPQWAQQLPQTTQNRLARASQLSRERGERTRKSAAERRSGARISGTAVLPA